MECKILCWYEETIFKRGIPLRTKLTIWKKRNLKPDASLFWKCHVISRIQDFPDLVTVWWRYCQNIEIYITDSILVSPSPPLKTERLLKHFKTSKIFEKYLQVSLALGCPMSLELFPLDSQICHITLASYGWTDDDVKYIWTVSLSLEKV